MNYAAENCNGNVVKVLIENMADVNLANLNIRSMLLLVIKKGYRDEVEALRDKADNKAALDWWIMLLLVFEKGHKDVVKAFIGKVSDVDRAVPNLYPRTGRWIPLSWAVRECKIDTYEPIVNHITKLIAYTSVHKSAV